MRSSYPIAQNILSSTEKLRPGELDVTKLCSWRSACFDTKESTTIFFVGLRLDVLATTPGPLAHGEVVRFTLRFFTGHFVRQNSILCSVVIAMLADMMPIVSKGFSSYCSFGCRLELGLPKGPRARQAHTLISTLISAWKLNAYILKTLNFKGS